MIHRSEHCDTALLQSSLDDRLSELQEEQLARHLESCEQCRAELERLAAAGEQWTRIGSVLRDAFPNDSSFVISSATPDPETDSVADFAVDFLDASPKPGMLGQLGDIDVQEIIGQGGMGIVLKGFQPELNRPVAVKMLAPYLASSGAARKRFAREAQATAVIVHPNVMPILTVNSAAKLPYLVMPYVPCESLQQRIDREGALPLLDILRIGLQVAKGLAAAHAQGLIHRDVKPANILLEKGVQRVMLTDFGLARAVDDASLTRTGVIAGTPQYMSPEQAQGDAVDVRSDQFSLGSVLYAMCTGRGPFRAETSYGILRRVSDANPRPIREVNSDIPDWLSRLIARLHGKTPDERFADVEGVAGLLEQCLAHVQQPSVSQLPESLRERKHRVPFKRTMIWLACLLGIFAVGMIIASKRSDDSSLVPPPSSLNDSLDPGHSTRNSSASWSDGLDEEILQLNQDVDRLKQEAGKLWHLPNTITPPSEAAP